MSVILATFNAGSFLRTCIASILKQSLEDYELIIVDDGSTDQSHKIVEGFTDRRIKYFCLPENCGVAQARNFGLMMASGDYIAVMDSDDQAHPRRLERQVAYLNSRPRIGIVGSHVIKAVKSRHILMKYVDNDAIIKARLLALNGSALIHPSTMIRHKTLRDLYINYPGTKTDEDHHMWFLAAKRGINFGVVEEPLLIYRRHGKNITSEGSLDAKAHQARKGPLRTEILSHFFPNASRTALKQVANLFGINRIRNKKFFYGSEFSDFYKTIDKQSSVLGESRTELKKIINWALRRHF
ncbi:glycosyltransferase family 2 protein [Spiribacter sp. 227]|uniref:Glycosyltransferase family 2 protein n=1 Tax=Spiribacter onubensis TaxID=3122420 RepID=A0ABV3S9J4_9GAMM